VTKADIANRTTLDELSQQLTALNPGGSITFSSNGNINARDILGAVHFDPFENESSLSSWFNIDAYHAHARLHTSDRFLADAGVRSWTIRGEHPVDWSILSKRLGAIVAQFGDTLLRLKGIVYTTGEQRPFVIHSVSRLFHAPKRMKDSKIRSGCTIVIIGESGAEPAVQLVRDAVAAASLTNKSFSMQNLLQ
jgi:G3E family GTPase